MELIPISKKKISKNYTNLRDLLLLMMLGHQCGYDRQLSRNK